MASSLKVLRRRAHVIVAERVNVGREVDQSEAILRLQRLEQLAAGGPRLVHLCASHRARDVEYERDVPRSDGSAPASIGRRDRDHDEAVLTTRRVRQHRDRRRVGPRDRDEQRRVPRIAANGDLRFRSVVAEIQLVRRRVGAAQARIRLIHQGQADA